jgi:hypothetical protein
MRTHFLLAVLCQSVLLAACAPHVAFNTSPNAYRVQGELMPSPAEYNYVPLSAEAGAKTFAKNGMGDPYGAGIAYPLWLAMLAAYPEELGGSVEGFRTKFGFLKPENTDPADKDNALPVGFHLTEDPLTHVSFVMMNCSACHAEEIRTPAGRNVVIGLGNKRVRIHAYDAALMRIGTSFSAKKLADGCLAQAEKNHVLWPPEVRSPILDTSERLFHIKGAARKADAEFLAAKALPGRVATIESFVLAMKMGGANVGAISHAGYTKVPDVVGFPYRDTFNYDGSGIGSPTALAGEADFAFGARPTWYDSHRHLATSLFMYLRQFSRSLPFPGSTDKALAKRGEAAFETHCASCHGTYLGQEGQRRVNYRERVYPIEMIGTDPTRLNAVTKTFADAANAIPAARGLMEVVPSGGYVPPVLIGIWARGLYGHNGQWPSLAVLAMTDAERPKRFMVEADANYDLEHIGTPWHRDAPGEKPTGLNYVYDASVPGYGVQGHTFLSALDAETKRSVLEYLKTL